jgi:hypothetical protein
MLDDGPIALTDPPAMVEAEAEVEWLDPEPDAVSGPAEAPADDGFEAIIPQPEADAHSAGQLRPAAKASSASTARRAAGRRPQAGAQPTARTIAVPERRGLGASLWRKRHLLILAAVAGLVIATVGYRIARNRFQNLPQVAEVNLAEGSEAFDKGDWDSAKFKLGIAARALERLGARNAAEVRQAAEEAAILADLVRNPLEEIVDVAARARTPEDQKLKFDAHYKDHSILVDATFAAPAESGNGPDLDYRIFASPTRVGRIDLAGFRLFEGRKYKAGDTVVFGARLDSLALGENGTWLVKLKPDSGVFMTNHKALAKIWSDREQSEEDEP